MLFLLTLIFSLLFFPPLLVNINFYNSKLTQHAIHLRFSRFANRSGNAESNIKLIFDPFITNLSPCIGEIPRVWRFGPGYRHLVPLATQTMPRECKQTTARLACDRPSARLPLLQPGVLAYRFRFIRFLSVHDRRSTKYLPSVSFF